jgi:hypothetical protein
MSSTKTWGYVLLAPGRPTQADQHRVLAALGADPGEFGTVWVDEIERGKRGRNAGQTQLAERNDLLRAVKRGDRVVVADPYCLGLSAADAEWFLGELAGLGVTVTVNGSLYQIAPGDDVAALVEEVGRAQNRAQAAASKARARARAKAKSR